MATFQRQTNRPMLEPFPVLILSGETEHREKLARAVSGCGLRPVCCGTFAAAKALIAHRQFRVALCEDLLPDGDFCAVIGETTGNEEKLPVIVVSRRDDWDAYLAAMRAGAFDYVAFPPNPGEIERVLYAALSESARLERALAHPAA